MSTPTVSRTHNELDEIYTELRRGSGRERVTDSNAEELAQRAEKEGHPVLAQELREWKAGCGSMRGQNRANRASS